MRLACVLAVLTVAIGGCMRPVKAGRTSPKQPASDEEIDAASRLRSRRCSPAFAYLFPGLGQVCTRKTNVGLILAGLAGAEIGGAVTAATQVEVPPDTSVLEHPAVFVPITALQDLYVYGVADSIIDEHLAKRSLYAPRDSLVDLAAAPFNLEVMRQSRVFLGLAGMLAIGLGVTFAVSEIDDSNVGGKPNVFGREFSKGVGYPLGAAVYGGLFTHVGIAEEAFFRGVVQSGLARSQGELGGLIYGSLIFGAVHAPNALAFEGSERRDYLIYALPTITLIGTYLGYLYKDADYSLGPSTAVHFWYDFLLSATLFAIEPDNSLLSAKIGFGF